MNPLQQLHDAGQGVWLDFLRRGLITGGELKRMTKEYALTGVTSNPSIFKKAIGGSTDYDEAIKRIVEGGEYDSVDVFYDLALEDIRGAASVFRPAYEQTGGKDGFVSFELEPKLAHDTAGSVAKAKELWERFANPNVMIKVPGTREGVPAVEELTAAGINVNITLLFAVSSYKEVARAYIRGLQRRLEAGEPISGLSSVASFFVSRVDSAVDALLPKDSGLRGKIAIANAKMAYQAFREIFSGPNWEALAEAGAKVQRPLWASTGTKNPEYSDVLYIEELVGRDTVNTMPQHTMDAFKDHGRVRPDSVLEGVDEAARQIEELAAGGIDLEEIALKLEDEGIEAFEKDLNSLLETLEDKVERVRAGIVRWRSNLGDLDRFVSSKLEEFGQIDLVGRVWRKDHTLWSPSPEEITNRLGWLHLPETMQEIYPALEAFAKQTIADGFRHCVLLGMGGSSLAPEVCRECFGAAEGAIDLQVLDSTHPSTINRIARSVDLEQTLFVVASKSGTTIETLSHYAFFRDLVRHPEHFVAITDPGTPLEELAEKEGFRAVFGNPSDIGGRFSALSLFGMLPAALMGVDIPGLLDRAEEMACACHECVPDNENPGAWLGAVLGCGALSGRDKVTLLITPRFEGFGSWVEQLIAESTGKQGKGILPVVGERLGSPDVYGTDRIFVAMGDVWGVEALTEAGHPLVQIPLGDLLDLGAEFFRWEFAIAVAGHVLGINAFDQPDVAAAKEATKRVLDSGDFEDPGMDDLGDLLASVRPGDYVAIQAYLDETPETTSRLEEARLAIRDRYRVATTVGFGPRFLHSTGQLHKGGPDSGVFIQVVDTEKDEDVPIPSRPYTFRQLIDAQALGDLRTLRTRGRRVGRVTLDALDGVRG
ncbi:MAG: bifunctional transaldolase/phosoglucose isomerase [Actinomycetota bacterium]|nr:bifunctional transaldolase/phosoglucose isomerase [Actinomycetota bacterium]